MSGLRAHAELLELLAKLRDAELTQADAARIEQLVRDDEAACDLYVHYVQMHVHLSCYAASQPPPPPAATPTANWPAAAQNLWRFANQPHVFGLFFASVFMLAGLTLLRIFPLALIDDVGPSAAPQTEQFIARLTATREAVWRDKHSAVAMGQHLRPGARLRLAGGSVTVSLKNQAELVLEGPGELELTSPSQARLIQGRIVARAPRTARGFIVDTPQARVIDLGTEFGVEVAADERTYVEVFAGEVRVERFEQTAAQRLIGGQAAEIDARRITVSTPQHSLRFASLRPPTKRPGEVIDLDLSAHWNADIVVNSPLLLDTTQVAADASQYCFATQTAAELLGVPGLARGLPDDGRFAPLEERRFAAQLAVRNDRDGDNAVQGRGPNVDLALNLLPAQRRAYEALHLFLTIGSGAEQNPLTITLFYADGEATCERTLPDWGREAPAPAYVLTQVDRVRPDGSGIDPQGPSWRIFGLPLPVESGRILHGLRVQGAADFHGVLNLLGATGQTTATMDISPPTEP